MADGISVDVSQLATITHDLRHASQEAQRQARVVVRHTAAAVERDAKQGAPVDTGNLRASINTTTTGNAYTTRSEVGPTANYGLFVEVGTSRTAPQPYLGPALDRNEPAFTQAMEQLAGDLL